MSTAMMSAPSSASRTACDRPCPRAAPVMNATLPSSLDICSPVPSWLTRVEVDGLGLAELADPGDAVLAADAGALVTAEGRPRVHRAAPPVQGHLAGPQLEGQLEGGPGILREDGARQAERRVVGD